MKSYAAAAAVILFTAAMFGSFIPTLISARDSLAVVLGLSIMATYPVILTITWKAWRKLPESQVIITKVKGLFNAQD